MPDMDFRSWCLENFTPVVMVVASPAVQEAVQSRNGLTLTDVLRPSGYFHHLSGETPVQSVHPKALTGYFQRRPGDADRQNQY